MKNKIILTGLASLALSVASHAAVKYVGTPGGTASSIVDLAVPSVDGVVYTEATFEAAFGGDYTPAASAVNGVPTWQLTADNTYVLEDIVAIANGNLIIDAGTVVRGQPRSNTSVFDGGALLIAAGAKLIAAGEATNPIVFTTASTTGDNVNFGGRASGANPVFWDQPGVLAPKSAEVAGLWGGLLILGKAPTNVDRDAGIAAGVAGNAVGTTGGGTVDQVIFGYGTGALKNTFAGSYTNGATYTGLTTTATTDDRSSIEGVPATASIALAGLDRFGGFEADDNSGIIKYASIRHGGSNLAANSEVNGLTLGAVGRGTTISYVEIYGNTDDGIELFGGNVNLDHVVVIAQQDDGIDIDAGYAGTIQFALVMSGSNSDKLLEWDGSYETETVNGFAVASPTVVSHVPVGNWALYNATLVANSTQAQSHNGIHIRDQSAPRLLNSIALLRSDCRLEVDNRLALPNARATTNQFATGIAEITGLSVQGVADVATLVANGNDDATIEAHLNEVARATSFGTLGLSASTPGALSGGNLFVVVPNGTGSASLDAVLDDGTFSANATKAFVTYRGAFEPNTLEVWTNGWTAAALAQVIAQ